MAANRNKSSITPKEAYEAYLAVGNLLAVAQTYHTSTDRLREMIVAYCDELGIPSIIKKRGQKVFFDLHKTTVPPPTEPLGGRTPAAERFPGSVAAQRRAEIDRLARQIKDEGILRSLPRPKQEPKPVPPQHFEDTDLSQLCRICEDPARDVVEFHLVQITDKGLKDTGSVKLCQNDWLMLAGKKSAGRKQQKAS